MHRPVHCSRLAWTELKTNYNFQSQRYYPLAKLGLLHHLPSHVDKIILADTDALLLPWYRRVSLTVL